jgi:hypothetical protein
MATATTHEQNLPRASTRLHAGTLRLFGLATLPLCPRSSHFMDGRLLGSYRQLA